MQELPVAPQQDPLELYHSQTLGAALLDAVVELDV